MDISVTNSGVSAATSRPVSGSQNTRADSDIVSLLLQPSSSLSVPAPAAHTPPSVESRGAAFLWPAKQLSAPAAPTLAADGVSEVVIPALAPAPPPPPSGPAAFTAARGATSASTAHSLSLPPTAPLTLAAAHRRASMAPSITRDFAERLRSVVKQQRGGPHSESGGVNRRGRTALAVVVPPSAPEADLSSSASSCDEESTAPAGEEGLDTQGCMMPLPTFMMNSSPPPNPLNAVVATPPLPPQAPPTSATAPPKGRGRGGNLCVPPPPQQQQHPHHSSMSGADSPSTSAAFPQRNASPNAASLLAADSHLLDSFNVSSLAQHALSRSVASITTRPPTTASNELLRRKVDGVSYINHYRVIRTLGRGACGKVKLAFDEKAKRLVAVKAVRRADTRKRIGGLTTAQKQYNAFMREIEVMKKLRHRNIVSLYEVIDDPSVHKLYLVMQYVDKGVVAKVEVRGSSEYVCDPVPPQQLARYAREMLTGLEYLHSHDIVHRDLKPDNILVSKDGHAYLADFGVAEAFDTSYRRRRETLMAQSMAMSMAMSTAGGRAGGPQVLGTKGTPLFIAPELWDGAKSYGKPVDMWAMGVTLFTLLVGKLPFCSPEDITDAAFTPSVPTEFGPKWGLLLAGLLNRNPLARWTVEAALAYVAKSFAEKKEGGCELSDAAAITDTPPSYDGMAAGNKHGTTAPATSLAAAGGATASTKSSSNSPAPNVSPVRAPVLLHRASHDVVFPAADGEARAPSSATAPRCNRSPTQNTMSPSAGSTSSGSGSTGGAGSPPAASRTTRSGFSGSEMTFDHTISASSHTSGSTGTAAFPPPAAAGTPHHRRAVGCLSGYPTTPSPLADRGEGVNRPQGLDEVSMSAPIHMRVGSEPPPTHTYLHLPSTSSCASASTTPPLTYRPSPPPPPMLLRRPHTQRDSSLEESGDPQGESGGDCPGVPSFEESASDVELSTPREEHQPKMACSLPHPYPHAHLYHRVPQQQQLSPASADLLHHPFAARRVSRLLAEAQAPANGGTTITTPAAAAAASTPDDPTCRHIFAADSAHAPSQWMPLSNASTTQSADFALIASSHVPSVSTVEEKTGASTSGVYNSVLSPRLLLPSMPRSRTPRSSERDESAMALSPLAVAPSSAALCNASHLSVAYNSRFISLLSKEEQGSPVPRPPPSPFRLPRSATPDTSSSNDSNASAAAGIATTTTNTASSRMMPYSLNARCINANPLHESRDRSACATPVDSVSDTMSGSRSPLPNPRSPARLPGIVQNPAVIPSPPSFVPLAAAFSAPSAVLPLKIAPSTTAARRLMARSQRHRSGLISSGQCARTPGLRSDSPPSET